MRKKLERLGTRLIQYHVLARNGVTSLSLPLSLPLSLSLSLSPFLPPPLSLPPSLSPSLSLSLPSRRGSSFWSPVHDRPPRGQSNGRQRSRECPSHRHSLRGPGPLRSSQVWNRELCAPSSASSTTHWELHMQTDSIPQAGRMKFSCWMSASLVPSLSNPAV